MMLVQLNVTMKPLNDRTKKGNHQMIGKKRGTTKTDKRIVTCDVGTTQYEDGTVKREKNKVDH